MEPQSSRGCLPYGIAAAEFLVAVPSFGEPSNGATAEVTFPEVQVSGLASGPQSLSFEYGNIPSVSSYDWSTNPPDIRGLSDAAWEEPLENLTTLSQIVVGTNHAAQQRDSNFTHRRHAFRHRRQRAHRGCPGSTARLTGSGESDPATTRPPTVMVRPPTVGQQVVTEPAARPGTGSSGEKCAHPADCRPLGRDTQRPMAQCVANLAPGTAPA